MYVLGTLSRLRSVKHMSIKVAAYCRVSIDLYLKKKQKKVMNKMLEYHLKKNRRQNCQRLIKLILVKS